MFGCKHLAGNPARRQGKEIVVPVLNALDFGQILARVLLSYNLCASGMQPFVAGGVIEVPMRIDQVRDGIGAEIRQSLSELRARRTYAAIDEHFAVRPGQNGDVAAGALEHADVVPQLVGCDRRYRGAILEQTDEASRLRKCFAGRKPSARCRVSRSADATEAK